MNLTLISANIRFNNPADGVNAWPHRKQFLADLLQGYNPDIIATQEGRLDQLQELLSLLPDFEMINQHRNWIAERMYPTIFIKKHTFELENSFDKWLSETPDVAGSKSFDSAFPRLMTGAVLKHKAVLKPLLVVNTHFDHIKPSTRVEQARVLSTEVKKVIEPDHRLILMGDYNDSPDSETRQVVSATFPHLQDAWRLFNHVEETSHHGFNSEINAGSRIDWILVDQKTKIVDSFLDKSHRGDVYPSDHYPVIAKIKLE